MIDTYQGAWFGSAELKAEVMERLLLHRQRDEIVQGYYQEAFPTWPSGYKGCAVGCTLPHMKGMENDDLDWHAELEKFYNIPANVARLIDETFEAQRGFEKAAQFAVDSIAAIAVGADLRGLAQVLGDEWEHLDLCEEEWDSCPLCIKIDSMREGRSAEVVIDSFKGAPIAAGARSMILVG